MVKKFSLKHMFHPSWVATASPQGLPQGCTYSQTIYVNMQHEGSVFAPRIARWIFLPARQKKCGGLYVNISKISLCPPQDGRGTFGTRQSPSGPDQSRIMSDQLCSESDVSKAFLAVSCRRSYMVFRNSLLANRIAVAAQRWLPHVF